MATSSFNSALFMIVSRFLSMFIGIAGIPILLTCLGRDNFSSWAILLGGSVIFYVLEMGMTPTVVKFIKEAEYKNHSTQVSHILSNAVVLISIVFIAGFMIFILIVKPVAAFLNLPDTEMFSAASLLLFVYGAVTACSVLRVGVNTLHAAEMFDMVAVISLIHSLIPNLVSWIAAYCWKRLDLVILSFWVCQILVLFAAQYLAKRIIPWKFKVSSVNINSMKSMLLHGFNIQFNDLSHFFNFQFDKMIIAGVVGISEVAHYEIGSRAGMALRSLCSSGLGTFLPSATAQYVSGADIWNSYLNLTRSAVHTIILFLLLPLIVSPIFLFAWVGQIGYHGRWVFMFLTIGISFGVLIIPVSIFVQAMGRTIMETRFAVCSIILNVVLSLTLVQFWGKEGAAAGTGISMSLAGLGYIYAFHRIHKKKLVDTLKSLTGQFWPFIPICIIWVGLEILIEPLVISSRWYMAPASVGLYLSCFFTLLITYGYTGRFSSSEKELIGRVKGFKWIADLSGR